MTPLADSVVPPPPDPSTRAVDDRGGTDGPSLERSVRALVSTPVGVTVLLSGGVLAIDAFGTDDGPGFCVFRRCTGGYCPGCGLTRATRHLARGEVGAAWHDHPWILFAAVQIAVAVGVWGVVRRRARRIDWSRPAGVLAVVNAVALVVIWAIRLTNGSIPRFF